MSRDSTVIPFVSLNEELTVHDPNLREGARRMLAQVLIAEADAFVALWKDLKLPDGRDRIVRHGHGPDRTIQTGVGPVEVRRAQGARSGRCRHGGESSSARRSCRSGRGGRRNRRAVAGSLPARSVHRRFPGGAHCPLGQGRAEPVAGRDLAADGGVAGGLRRLAEARSVGAAIRVCSGHGFYLQAEWKTTPNACWC